MLSSLYLKMVYIVEITRISAFRGHDQLFFFLLLFFCVSDNFTLSPLGVPPAVRWIVKGLTQGSLDWRQEEDERIVWLFHTALISSTQQSDFWVSNLSISFNSSNNTFAWCLAQVQNETFLYIIVKLLLFFFHFCTGGKVILCFIYIKFFYLKRSKTIYLLKEEQ